MDHNWRTLPKIAFYVFFFFFLQEGANINKSLTTLGKVISALAEVVRFHFYTFTLLYEIQATEFVFGKLTNVGISPPTDRTRHQTRSAQLIMTKNLNICHSNML